MPGKIGALVLAVVMVMAMGTVAFATGVDLGNDGTYGDGGASATAISSKAVNIKKEITAFNKDASTIYAPVITYTYTITPGTVDKSITDSDDIQANTLTGIVVGLKATGSTNGTLNASGTTASAATVSADIVWNTNGEFSTDTVANGGAANISDLELDFSGVSFTRAGVYRYKIEETYTSGAYANAGVTESTLTATDKHVRYLDVYVKDGSSAGSYDIYGFVCFTENNDIYDGTTGTNTVDAAKKTTGFTDTDSTVATNADSYYTFNVELSKTVENDQYTKTTHHQFPFSVGFTNSTVTTAVRFKTDNSASNVTDSYDGNAHTFASGDLNVVDKIADDSHIKYIGIPYGTTVAVYETNDVTGVTYKAETFLHGSSTATSTDSGLTAGTTPTVYAAHTGAAGQSTAASFTPAVADLDSTAYAVDITNTLELISPTGVVLRIAPYALMLAAGVVLLVLSRRRKNRAEEA